MNGIPELALEIGKTPSFALTIEAGASGNRIDMGGLPIWRLAMSHGAGFVRTDVFHAQPPVNAALFVVGYVKGQFTGVRPLRSATQTMIIGGIAALAAFGLARLVAWKPPPEPPGLLS